MRKTYNFSNYCACVVFEQGNRFKMARLGLSVYLKAVKLNRIETSHTVLDRFVEKPEHTKTPEHTNNPIYQI